jgi:hypothetical protein
MPSTTDQQPENQGIFALFKGDSGSGKSVGALSFPNPYVFDFDKKMPNIALKHFPNKKIDYDTFENVFQVQDKLNSFYSFCPYETLIFDTLTSLVVTILNTVGSVKGEDPVAMMKNMKKMGEGLVGYDYYNAETNFIERYLLDACKALFVRAGNPKNIIFIAHVMTSESAPDMKTKIVTRTRRIVTAGRSVAAYIPTQFDDKWHFAYRIGNDGRNERVALTESIGEDFAGTSFRLPAEIEFTGKPPFFEEGNLYKKFMKIISGDISL